MRPECWREVTGDAEGGAPPLTTRRARGGPRVCWGPDSTEQHSGQRHGMAASEAGSWSLALGTGVLRDGDSATWGAAPAARAPRRAPRRPRGQQPARGQPRLSPLPPAWFQEVKQMFEQQRPQSLTGHCCTRVPSTRRRGTGAGPRR